MKISLKAFVYSAALILPALFVACGGGGDPTPPPQATKSAGKINAAL